MINPLHCVVATVASGVLLGCAAPAAAPPGSGGAAEAAVAAEITPTEMYATISFLAADALRGRDTPSPGLEAAAAYLVSEYQRLGLEPAGENGSFYQRYPFPLRQLDLQRAGFRVGSPTGEQRLEYGADFFTMGATAGEISAPLVFIGRSFPTGPTGTGGAGALQDRIAVYVLPGDYSRDWRSLRGQQAREAQAEGAVAAVHVLAPGWNPDSIAEFARRAAVPARTLGDEPQFPQFMLSYAAAQRVLAGAGLALDELWTEAFAGTLAPLAVPRVTATAGLFLQELERGLAPNVAAVLPGSDPTLRDEYVVLSAHMDHVGVGEPVNGDSIYNGADDDASGTAALLEIARAMSESPNRPRRSVLFLHVSGEEKGLLGSRWFSEHPTVPLERIVANLNVDMIGRNSPDSIVVIGREYSSLGPLVASTAAEHPELGLVVSDDIWPEERFFFRSDHFNFARKEIPALFFFAGVHECYHRPCDEVEDIDVEKAAEVARLILYTTERIANQPERPAWDPQGLEQIREMTR